MYRIVHVHIRLEKNEISFTEKSFRDCALSGFALALKFILRGIAAFEITCKCNEHPRQVWFFRALPLEILVGWLVDGER